MDSTLQHVLVAVVAVAGAAWIGAVAASTTMLARARAGGDASVVVTRAGTVARVAHAAALPAAVVVAAAGAWYVLGRDLAIDPHWWIGTALGAWITCFFGATAMRGRHLRSAITLSERDGAGDEEVQWRIRRVDLLARGELLLLVVAAAVVVLQPTA
jgi:hypothetical protein